MNDTDKFVLITSDRDIFYFDEERLFDFLNRVEKTDDDEDDNDGYEVLSEFPLPRENNGGPSPLGKDSDGRHYGNYCPFGCDTVWPENTVLILNQTKGTIYVPKKRSITKEVIAYEFAPPPQMGRPKSSKNSVKKAPAKKASPASKK